jgi:hypothetical protein
VLRVDKRHLAALFLGGGDDMQGQRRFAGGLGTVYLDDPALGHAADAQRQIQ